EVVNHAHKTNAHDADANHAPPQAKKCPGSGVRRPRPVYSDQKPLPIIFGVLKTKSVFALAWMRLNRSTRCGELAPGETRFVQLERLVFQLIFTKPSFDFYKEIVMLSFSPTEQG